MLFTYFTLEQDLLQQQQDTKRAQDIAGKLELIALQQEKKAKQLDKNEAAFTAAVGPPTPSGHFDTVGSLADQEGVKKKKRGQKTKQLDLDNLGKHTVAELKEYCRDKKLSVKGSRKEHYMAAIKQHQEKEKENRMEE